MKPLPFIGLLILDVINRFIFGHGVVIYYLQFQLHHIMTETVGNLVVKYIPPASTTRNRTFEKNGINTVLEIGQQEMSRLVTKPTK